MVRVCVIGAGLGGMCFIREVQRLQKEDSSVCIEIVCYEKQSTWGGQWNFSWRQGVDEFGEPECLKMYRGLWSNSPKEISEFADYTLQEHFKKNLPAFVPREVLEEYYKAYWTKLKLDEYDIRYNHTVRSVKYDSELDMFKVVTLNLKTGVTSNEELFDYLVNCTGHYMVENIPTFEGMETFPNSIIHTGYIKSYFELVTDKRVLVIGTSFSGNDSVIECIKHGAKSIISSYKSVPISSYAKLPSLVTERPDVKRVNGLEVTFVDGSTEEVDMIILATGYIHHYPYLSDDLRLRLRRNLFYPEGLHLGTLWLRGGNRKLLYVGAQQLYFPVALIAQSRWIVMYITGKMNLREGDEFENLDKHYLQREADKKTGLDAASLQIDWISQLAQDGQLTVNVNWLSEFAEQYFKAQMDMGLDKYKNCRYKSQYTGTLSAEMFRPYMEIKYCSLEELLSHYS